MLRSFLLFLLPILLTSCGKSDRTFLKVGTGSQVGVYYAAGLAMAQVVHEKDPKLDLAVESTDGSVYNINGVAQGNLDFAFAQADRQYQAVRGEGAWEGKPQEQLRFICSFHTEAVTLVAATDKRVKALADLRGTTTSLGSPASGTQGNAIDCLSAVGLVPEKDFNAEMLKASEASMMLQDGRIDAFFYTVGHPNGSLVEATNGRRPVRFVPITNMGALLSRSPYYSQVTIPKEYYPKSANEQDIPTIGMRTTLVTSTAVSDEVVYEVVKLLFENLPEFQKRHPSFERLTAKQMVEGGFAPYHPGALRYFQEVGLVSDEG